MTTNNGRTHFDLDALDRLRAAEKAVIEATKVWNERLGWSTLSEMHEAEHALAAAVRALRFLDASQGEG